MSWIRFSGVIIYSCHVGSIGLMTILSALCDYRTINGTCNNKNHPLIGSAGRAYRRLLDADYFDCEYVTCQCVTVSTPPVSA